MSAGVAFAASDNNATVGEVTDEIAIDEDILTIEEDSVVLQENETPAVENTVVTNSTFYQYFDETGSLLNNTTTDELVFEGDFSGVGVNYIAVDKAIKFTGNNATFKDVSFVISSDNVTIDGFTLSQSNNVSLISVGEANNVIISNNVLNFEAMADIDGYAILQVM